MKRMNLIIVQSLVAILLGGGMSATAHAQYDPGITVNVPFAFSADGQEIAAGTYKFQLISSNFLMSVRNVNTGNEQMITVRPEEARKFASSGSLIFQVCEGHSYLAEIHIPGSNLFSETAKGHKRNDAETETCSKDEGTTVALR
jgi:hypothetical protein